MQNLKNKFEDGWQNKWKEILENLDGSINVEQLKKELFDFDDMIDRITELTCYMTFNKLSYPTYPVETIVAVHEDGLREIKEDQKKDDEHDGICSLCEREFE